MAPDRAIRWGAVIGALLAPVYAFAAEPQAAVGADAVREIYARECAACHGADRLGGTGPALLPEGLGRLQQNQAAKAIAEGRAATQMPAFGDRLAEGEIAALVKMIYTSLASVPPWGAAEIEASRVVQGGPPATRPTFEADPLNLFVVVETGDHHATILDGDRFEPVHRFATRFALHGGPKFTPDGRYVFFMSRDGWVSKFDLWGLETVAEVRAGINSRNIALSEDGRHVAVANYLPHSLVILKAEDLSVERVLPAADRWNRSSRVSAVYQAPMRKSFIVALKDVAEVWEVSTDEASPARHSGLVHSHETGRTEAVGGVAGLFALRRIETAEPIDDFFFTPDYRNLIGSARDGANAVVVNLNVGRDVARIDLPGLPHLGSGIAWTWQGRPVMATPHLKEGRVSVIDLETWRIVKTIETKGPGFFMRSHENSPYAWVDVFFGPHRDLMHVIDKRTLEIVKTLQPAPGLTSAHVEFDRDGSHALVSIWEKDGALVVYDAKTLTEVKRIAMSRPSGKYNVWNKIRFSEGTSH